MFISQKLIFGIHIQQCRWTWNKLLNDPRQNRGFFLYRQSPIFLSSRISSRKYALPASRVLLRTIPINVLRRYSSSAVLLLCSHPTHVIFYSIDLLSSISIFANSPFGIKINSYCNIPSLLDVFLKSPSFFPFKNPLNLPPLPLDGASLSVV